MNAPSLSDAHSIAVTGIGVFCPIGKNPEEVAASLRESRGGIGEIASFDTRGLRVRHAAEIQGYDPLAYFPAAAEQLDRTAQFAILSARQAAQDASLPDGLRGSARLALVMGICAGGQGESNTPGDGGSYWGEEKLSQRFLETAHYYQTDAVASDLGLHGPTITVSTACASSTSALGVGYALLQAGSADAVLVGGADAFSLFTYAGFYALGAMPAQPTSPFSAQTGVTFGEGAGCVVLERRAHAEARGARIYGSLLGCGMSSDAHHITAPHPAGEGLARALASALRQAGLSPAAVDYINAHGTGTQDNDVAETLAIRALYAEGASIPPVSSTKSFFGHTLGAAGILEFIACLLAMRQELIPPTLNFVTARPGCDLDYVPNRARPARVETFLSSSAAFGGVNAVAVGGRLRAPAPRSIPVDEVYVTGLGLLSPVGFGSSAFAAALREGRSGISAIERFPCSDCVCRHAGLIQGFNARKLDPTVDVRRMDTLTQYAVVATSLALKDAGLRQRMKPTRVGLVVALTRGPVATQEQFLQSLSRDGIEGLSAKYFPSMVLSTLSGQVAQTCQIKGASLTIVDGRTAGLQALVAATEYLRQSEELDALVVVAADELARLHYQLFDRLGLLADTRQQGAEPRPYDASAGGPILGEGAAALVLERGASVRSRDARCYGRIAGYARSADALPGYALDPQGKWLEGAARQAVQAAGLDFGAIDALYGHGCGDPDYDRREMAVMQRLVQDRNVPVGCVLGSTGLAEAASGLFTASAALLGMQNGEVYPVAAPGELPGCLPFVRDAAHQAQLRHTLVLGSTEHGNNTAVLLAGEAAA